MHDCECFRVRFKNLHDIPWPVLSFSVAHDLGLILSQRVNTELNVFTTSLHLAMCIYGSSTMETADAPSPVKLFRPAVHGPFVSQHLSSSLNLHSCEILREHWSIEGLLSACTLWWRSEGECAQHTSNSTKTSRSLLTSCRHAIYRNH